MKRSVLKNNAPVFEWLVRTLDPLLVAITGLAVYAAYLGGIDPPERYVLAMVGMSFACATLFPFIGLYSPQRGVTLFEEVRRLANAWLILAAIWFAFLFLSKTGIEFSRVWSTYWIVGGFATHLVFRGGIRAILRALRRRGYNLRHVMIIGAGRLGQEIAERLRRTPWSGLAVRAFYDDDPQLAGAVLEGVPVKGPVDRALQDLDADAIDQVWIALPMRAEARIRELLLGLRMHPVQVRFVPDIFNFTLLHHSMTEIAGFPVINLTDSPLDGANRVVKNIEDLALSLVILTFGSPVMLLIALAVKLSSPGPVLYAQQRVTWNGERFMMLKFRSMPVNAEAHSGPVWATRGEPRATRLGSFLRRTSLDELPQFINVLRGEMSIVGPRPERPEFVHRFRQEIPGYMQKHLVKAGITGWAQVNDLRGDTNLQERIRYDLYYIENWSLWFDLRIMALTVIHIFRSRHAG
ncbi:MAG: undecaprenyl-phosphate glucose phosphotransferase [Pseudomonadota bacterium]|nr:undecaprenyl-phosphate glucose phosphotransferase [Pseudomonadota bacterium]